MCAQAASGQAVWQKLFSNTIRDQTSLKKAAKEQLFLF